MKGFVVFLIAVSFIWLSRSTSAQSAVTYWREHSTELPQFWDSDTKPVIVPAPKGNLSLNVTSRRTGKRYPEDELVPDYYIVRNGSRLSAAIHPYSSPSDLWSPSSELLAVMSTDGGLVGTWNVYVYSLNAQQVVAHNVMRHVRADLAIRYPAGMNPPGTHFFSAKGRREFTRDNRWVNVFACGWLTQPERLIVTAGVPPSSRYGLNMGSEVVYVIEPLSGKILHKYTDKEAKSALPQCLYQ